MTEKKHPKQEVIVPYTKTTEFEIEGAKQMGIVALIVSFFYGTIGIILGAIALKRSKKHGLENKPALAGIIIGIVRISLITLIIIIFVILFAIGYNVNKNNPIDIKHDYGTLPINVLGKIDDTSAGYETDGQKTPCQPDVFDSSDTFEAVEVSTSISANVYTYTCASSKSYIIEVFNSGVRRNLYTNVINYSFNESKNKMFIIMDHYVTNNGWKLQRGIVSMEYDNFYSLSNLACMSNNLGVWQGDRLLTYGEINKDQNQTSVCVWEDNAILVSVVEVGTSWQSASKDYLAEQIGLLSNDSDIFYAYTSTDKYTCSLILADITDNTKVKSIDILDKDDYPDSLNCSSPAVQFDFSDLEYDYGSLRYRIETGSQSGEVIYGESKTISNEE